MTPRLTPHPHTLRCLLVSLPRSALRRALKRTFPEGLPELVPGMSAPLVLALAAALVLSLGLSGCDRNEAAPAAEAPPVAEGQVLRYPAGHSQLRLLRVAPARSETDAELQLPAHVVWDESRTQRLYAPLAGRVEQLSADVGQTVQRGALLARLSSADLGQVQADAARALADQRLAAQQLTRQRELSEAGIVARRDLEQAEADSARANAEAARARSRLSLYGAAGGVDQQLGLRAGIAGVIVERNLNPGAEIRPDQSGPGVPALFVISDPSRLWVVVDARENDLAALRPGTRFTLEVPAWPGRAFDAVVTATADAIDPATRSIKVRAEVDNRERLLKAEMLGSARVRRPRADDVTVPAAAVLLDGDRHLVFVQTGPGVFEARPVKVARLGAREAALAGGVRPGEPIVIDNALLLARQLRLADDATPAAAAGSAPAGADTRADVSAQRKPRG
ncbi:efflux RND transporter periplasmic adaptor subunit [Roseateles chitosanitabidus]|uniref:efflux RND transporter periplasmic adaptor subunit n=1 Tax=Roseateles chitosanitabidus TaxID=65048 RepID=UPI000A01C46B|nr:efflux RND transporter periplasmic adaptor subunit [Roseateles chitosanitabidus]